MISVIDSGQTWINVDETRFIFVQTFLVKSIKGQMQNMGTPDNFLHKIFANLGKST